MLWMDIKIVDPEMEALMKQINEEQTRLKEALREKLSLMRGIHLDERNNSPTVKEENEVKIKEEPVDTEINENEYHEEKVNARSLDEVHQTKETGSNSMEETKNIDTEISRLDSNDEKKNDVSNKDDTVKENDQTTDKEIDNSNLDNLTTKEEFRVASRTCRSTQVNTQPVQDIPLNEKKPKRGLKRHRLLKKYRATLKRKKNTKEKKEEVQVIFCILMYQFIIRTH
ncbi:hypothetical protein KPH14_009624 [Odynerus spinipes]|uniref:Uncharacterized protein n=1 Tax=Odynerus spinipes TaxID=1348599 RepID=A0AAD9RPU3_9HYME|nr:hypothetical protein KPH14_009624 [Odynerus spinipes]